MQRHRSIATSRRLLHIVSIYLPIALSLCLSLCVSCLNVSIVRPSERQNVQNVLRTHTHHTTTTANAAAAAAATAGGAGCRCRRRHHHHRHCCCHYSLPLTPLTVSCLTTHRSSLPPPLLLLLT